jgi:putative membrane protein
LFTVAQAHCSALLSGTMGAEKRKRHVSKQHKNSSLFVQERYTLIDGIPLSYTLPFFHSWEKMPRQIFHSYFQYFLVKHMHKKHLLLWGLLLWYIGFLLFMGGNPVDPQNMVVANILPVFFVTLLVVSYPRIRFSYGSYVLITIFLTSHTIGSHYTYEQVPFGIWLENNLDLPRNHFDRIAHFSFGLFMPFPLDELFGKMAKLSTRMRLYIVCMTLMALAALWEILESWGARTLHPEMGLAYLGAQGDI